MSGVALGTELGELETETFEVLDLSFIDGDLAGSCTSTTACCNCSTSSTSTTSSTTSCSAP